MTRPQSTPLSTAGVATATGPRDDNQDAILSLPRHGVYAVADGMGGLADGRASAQTAVGAIASRASGLVDTLRRAQGSGEGQVADVLEELIWDANDAVRRAAVARHRPRRPPRSGCTLTVAIVVDDALYIAHVGDSRALLVGADEQRQLTEDHSVAAARVRRGRMTPEEAKHSPLRSRLYQACGLTDELDVDIVEVDIQPGDRVVLCSDGLWETVPLGDLAELVLDRPATEGADALLEAATEVGLVDNTTVVVIDPARKHQVVDKLAALARSPLFADFSAAQLRRLAPYVEVNRLSAGEVVVEEGEAGSAVFVLGSGSLVVERAGVVLTTLTPPGHFGEIAMLRESARTATVRAQEDGWVLALHRSHIDALIQRRPSLGARLGLRMAYALAERVVDLTERLAQR